MSKAWMPLYIADYLADTTHLDCAQSGAYLHLIMHYWQHGGLPDDDEKLARIVKAKHGQWMKMREILRDFFDENWKHKRIDVELKKSSDISQGKRDAANIRWCKRNANGSASAYADGMQMDMQMDMLRARALPQSHKDSFYQNAARVGAASPARGSRSAATPKAGKRKWLAEKELEKLREQVSKPLPISAELRAKLEEQERSRR